LSKAAKCPRKKKERRKGMQAQQTEYSPIVITETSDISEEKWLEYRRTGIGGSDAAAVIGVSPWTTARDTYYDKLQIVSAIDDENNWVQKEIGHLLENLVARIFKEKTGYRVFKIKKMFRHPLHTFMIADIDYFVEMPDGSIAILEIKTTNHNATGKWWNGDREIVPLNYELQGRHYMAVMNLNRVYFCCLYGNTENEVIIRYTDRDLDYESEMIALEEDFWTSHVQAKNPPPYTENGGLVLESVRRHHGAADPDAPEMTLDGGHAAGIARFLELQELKKDLDNRVKAVEHHMGRIKGTIVDAMGKSCLASCEVGGTPYLVTYNPVYKSGIDKNSLAKLKEQYPDIYDKFVTVNESRRFYLKEKRREAA
jgi:putative phage-type endonuclease